MHLKRQKAPKNWPIYRKGTKYVVRPNFNIKEGVPLLIILRDILKIAENRKEIKKALRLKKVLLNNDEVVNEKNIAQLFDIIKIVPSKDYYRVELSKNGKFQIKEIKENEADKKITKIVNKKVLAGKKIQLNLKDGKNFLSSIQCNVNDSILIDLKNKKIEKCIPLKEKARVIVFSGKHAGETGEIKKINKEKKMTELLSENKTINVLIKQLMAVE